MTNNKIWHKNKIIIQENKVLKSNDFCGIKVNKSVLLFLLYVQEGLEILKEKVTKKMDQEFLDIQYNLVLIFLLMAESKSSREIV